MKDHIQDLADWPIPGANRWLNAYHLMYKRYLELDDPSVPVPSEPIVLVDVAEEMKSSSQERRWREHVAWAKKYGVADDVLAMFKISPSVLRPEALETFQIKPWVNRN